MTWNVQFPGSILRFLFPFIGQPRHYNYPTSVKPKWGADVHHKPFAYASWKNIKKSGLLLNKLSGIKFIFLKFSYIKSTGLHPDAIWLTSYPISNFSNTNSNAVSWLVLVDMSTCHMQNGLLNEPCCKLQGTLVVLSRYICTVHSNLKSRGFGRMAYKMRSYSSSRYALPSALLKENEVPRFIHPTVM